VSRFSYFAMSHAKLLALVMSDCVALSAQLRDSLEDPRNRITDDHFASNASPDQRAELDLRFRGLASHNPIGPGETVSGFVLTHRSSGAKFAQLVLVAKGRARTFSIFVTVPEFEADYKKSEVFKRAADQQ
jgi:hypothetical protein